MSNTRRLEEETVALYERVRCAPENRALIAAVDAPSSEVAPLPAELCSQACLVLVPGILYRDYPETGADGAALKEIAASLSVPMMTIPLDGTEGRDTAAKTICNWLRMEVPQSKRVILVSLSKGSAEVVHALGEAGDSSAFDKVAAWVSVSGLPLGTPTLERALKNPFVLLFFRLLCYFKGWSGDAVRDLVRYRPATMLRIPSHVSFIQVAAFPLRRHLNDNRSRRFQSLIAELGPNDGFAPLESLACLPGQMYPLWGADHYLRGSADFPERIRRLLAFVLQHHM